MLERRKKKKKEQKREYSTENKKEAEITKKLEENFHGRILTTLGLRC